MATGDFEVYIGDADDDGTKLKAKMAGSGVVVADSINITTVGTRIWVLVIKA